MDLRSVYDAMNEIEARLQAEILQAALADAEHPEHLRSGVDDITLRYAAAAALMLDYLSGEIARAIDAGEMPEDPWGTGEDTPS